MKLMKHRNNLVQLRRKIVRKRDRMKNSQYISVKMQVLYTINHVLSQFQILLLHQNNDF